MTKFGKGTLLQTPYIPQNAHLYNMDTQYISTNICFFAKTTKKRQLPKAKNVNTKSTQEKHMKKEMSDIPQPSMLQQKCKNKKTKKMKNM